MIILYADRLIAHTCIYIYVLQNGTKISFLAPYKLELLSNKEVA